MIDSVMIIENPFDDLSEDCAWAGLAKLQFLPWNQYPDRPDPRVGQTES